MEYRHLKENRILRENGIRVLPIARQTKRFDGDQALGSVDAHANAHDILVTFGSDYLQTLGGKFFVFLDVEGAPSLSQAYYYYCVIRMDGGNRGIWVASAPGGLRSGGAGWRWNADYAVPF